MSTYMRSGAQQQYLHRAGCPHSKWYRRPFFRRHVPFDWAEDQPQVKLIRLVQVFDIKICRTCRPLK